ncbi:MAG: LysR family transcriptional regulator [Mesorhizobium sp.]|uniref:LysR family transcriptional regulator n=1 Tax=Mesorhizobium sp. TaxID=1871066 RepID=UPI000FE5FE58|nr:LysR family transcriptional regulator [Mesorhizobium sp.]RWB74549.1 MAG: LysR family transcriptional regulator [Mesorhizobium sp.]
MESRWLEDFLSLVDTRNFSRSAEARYTTQPAFSRRIKSLEDWVGAKLFDRTTQPISLTPSGERFRPVAEEVLRRLLQGREDARRVGETSANLIRFSATHSLSLTFFPSWIRSIEAKTHTFNIRLDSCQFNDCMQSLIKGESHFAISHAHPQVEMNLPPMHFTSKLVGTDRLLPVTLPDSAGSPLDKLPGTEDEPIHYLAYTETSAIGQAVEHMINNVEEPVYLDKVFVSQLAAVLKTLSREGRGMAWLPESNISDELASGSLVLAGGEKWFIPVEIRIFRSRERLPAMAEELWSILEGEAVPSDAPSPENC